MNLIAKYPYQSVGVWIYLGEMTKYWYTIDKIKIESIIFGYPHWVKTIRIMHSAHDTRFVRVNCKSFCCKISCCCCWLLPFTPIHHNAFFPFILAIAVIALQIRQLVYCSYLISKQCEWAELCHLYYIGVLAVSRKSCQS